MFAPLSYLALLPPTFAATFDVLVGPEGKLVFEPETVKASRGDDVRFTFNTKNHTVTQSSFDTPCVGTPNGARTGFVPVAPDTDPGHFPRRVFKVPEGTAPIWFYCGQTNHCGQGMVFAINPPDEDSPRSFSSYKARAIAQNGTLPSGSSRPPGYSTPPPPRGTTVTATVTWQESTYTTTYTSYDGSPDPTPAPEPVNHKILVGAERILNYHPANIQAKVGDIITFEFHDANHTATQSSFLEPCTALQDGFHSGFRSTPPKISTKPTWEVVVNDTAPIWGYCGQLNHCTSGMVFAINAPDSGPNTFQAFLELAQRTPVLPANAPPPSGGAADDPFAFLTGSFSADIPSPTGGAVVHGQNRRFFLLFSLALLKALGIFII